MKPLDESLVTLERLRDAIVKLHEEELFSKHPNEKWLDALTEAARTTKKLGLGRIK